MAVAGLLVILLVAFGLSRLVSRREGVPLDAPAHRAMCLGGCGTGATGRGLWRKEEEVWTAT